MRSHNQRDSCSEAITEKLHELNSLIARAKAIEQEMEQFAAQVFSGSAASFVDEEAMPVTTAMYKQISQTERPEENNPLKTSLHENIEQVKTALGQSPDIVIRNFRAGKKGKIGIGAIYIDGLVNKMFVQNFILQPLMLESKELDISKRDLHSQNALKVLKDFVLTFGEIKEIDNFTSLCTYVLSGYTIILLDGYAKGFAANSAELEARAISEATTQSTVRGPKDSFVETLQTNLSLIRRRIKDPTLRIEQQSIGRRTKTAVAMVYINKVADAKIVNEVRMRLNRIDIDGIIDSANVEELIQDETYTPFPTVYNTERPDTIAAGLLEGRIAIIVDGAPFVLLVPALFVHFFQSSEDYYQRYDIGTLIRILRYIAVFIALLAPSAYIAITTHHQEMIPFALLISIAAQRSGVPFPALAEAIIMDISFELFREAGSRMPRAIGSAVSIVGALVIGDAAVKAGIVSPVMVIIVAITAISGLTTPAYNMASSIRILRFIFMILSAIFGILGITMGLLALLLHLCSIRSFGIPYMNSFAPFVATEQKDAILRFPLWATPARPRLLSRKNLFRQQDPSQAKPSPPKEKS